MYTIYIYIHIMMYIQLCIMMYIIIYICIEILRKHRYEWKSCEKHYFFCYEYGFMGNHGITHALVVPVRV